MNADPNHSLSAQRGGHVDDRLEAAFRRARRHSGIVRLLKIALPTVAVALVAAFMFRSYLTVPSIAGFSLESAAVVGGKLVMSNPKLDGFTRDDRAYSMKAARASQAVGGSGRVDLEEIEARLPIDDSDWAMIKAPRGIFDREANILEIVSQMSVVTDTGMTALLQSAFVDIDGGSMTTGDPVTINMDGAHITADSMSIVDRGARFVFENRVRMRLEGDRVQTVRAEGMVE